MRAFVLLLLLAAAILLLVLLARRGIRTLRARRAPWELAEDSEHGALNVYARKAGQAPQLLGSVPWSARDFDYRIEEVRADARQRVIAANSGHPEVLVRQELL